MDNLSNGAAAEMTNVRAILNSPHFLNREAGPL